MNLTAIFTVAVSLLCASTYAAPVLGSDPPFRVHGLSVVKNSTLGGNVTISFTVRDPSKYGKGVACCNGTWVAGSKAFPTGSYEPCGNTSFAWNMQSFTTVHEFTLGLEHIFTDPEIGSYPYDIVDNYAAANVTPAVSQCETTGLIMNCTQLPHNVILAPIYASAAKRK